MKVLLATDGSECALAAARFLRGLPASELDVRLLTVSRQLAETDQDPALAATAEALGAQPGAFRAETRWGNPAEEILRAAEQEPADLIVLGSRGLSAIAQLILGSVATRVARHAPCSVLIVRGRDGGLQRVLVGVDGSECSQYAAEWLRGFPLPPGCAVRFVTVLPPTVDLVRATRMAPLAMAEEAVSLEKQIRTEATERLAGLVSRFKADGRAAEAELREGHGAMGLVETAEQWSADLLVVGAHGMSAVERFLMGSVSEQVLRDAPCSVLIVRPE